MSRAVDYLQWLDAGPFRQKTYEDAFIPNINTAKSFSFVKIEKMHLFNIKSWKLGALWYFVQLIPANITKERLFEIKNLREIIYEKSNVLQQYDVLFFIYVSDVDISSEMKQILADFSHVKAEFFKFKSTPICIYFNASTGEYTTPSEYVNIRKEYITKPLNHCIEQLIIPYLNQMNLNPLQQPQQQRGQLTDHRDELQKIIQRYKTIELKKMAKLLGYNDALELEKFLLELPPDSPLKIDGEMVIITTSSELEEQSAQLDKLFSEWDKHSRERIGKI